MRGDLTGIPEARHVDIEERLYPVSPADLERQLVRLKQERKDVTQEDIVKVVTMALRRPLTRDDAHLFESPSNIDDPDRWLDWFSSTLKTCDEARTANRNFENARVAIISDTRWSRFQRKNLASIELPGVGPIPETDCTPPEGVVLPIGGTKIPRLPAQQLVKVHGAVQYHLTDDRASFTLPLRDLELTRLPSAIWRICRRTLSSRRHYLDLALGGHHIESTLATPDGRSQTPESLSPGAVDSNNPLESPTVELPFLGLKDDELLSMVAPSPRPDQKVCQVGSNPNAPLVQVRIQTADTLALVDTGASVTVISEAFWNELGSPPLQKPVYGLVSASNTPIRTLGLRPCILGINLLRKLKALVNLSTNCVGFGDSPITLPFHTDDAQTTPRTVAHLKREDPREPPEQKAHEPAPSVSLHNVPTNWPTVHPTSTVYVKSNSRRLVLCHISSDLPEGCPILVESTASLSPLHIARSINIVRKEGFWVQVRNHSDTKLVIRPTDAIGVVTHLPDHYRNHTDTPASDTLPTPSPRSATSLRGGEREVPQEAETLCALSTGAQETSTKPGKEEIQIDWKDSSLSLEQKELLRKLLLRFDLFVSTSKAPGRTDLTKCHINTGDATPIKQAPFRVTQREGEIMEAEIKQLLELGLIRHSTSPWASPVLVIRKPDGSIRFCIDYRRLNDVTIKDCYPMPRVDDLLDVLGKFKFFTTMDVASGYWNVRMAEESIEKTAFTCKYGLYEWLVMPFGLCNAVPQFERLMEGVLQEYLWRICLVYLDDIIIFSEDFGEHLVRISQVLTRLQDAGFKLKASKCQWGRDRVGFLGHTITPGGILPNPEKVKAVLRIKPLKNVAQVRSFLGLAGYFRRFIKGYALLSRPLEKLNVADEFEWSPECQTSLPGLRTTFHGLRGRMLHSVALGAVLMQEQRGRHRVIALSLEQKELLRKLLLRFDLFVSTSKAPGRTDLTKCHINTGDATPIKQAPFRVTQREGEIMEAEIKQLLELGLIRHSTSPWASPVLVIRKPDGSIRFCIDYRRLNDVTIKDCYPMPRVDDLLDVLGKFKFFTTMDVASGYWNVRMAEESIEKTAFTCKYGLYEWLVMPFGLCNAVPQFERLMEGVLQEYLWRICLVYLDDIIIFSEDFGEHLVRISQVLTRLQDAGFKLKASKCQWGRDRVGFLGHTITPGGILPNPEKVKAVLRIKPLKNVAQVRSFLGLAGYFRRFIKGYALLSRPLEKLKVADEFEWSPECQTSLDNLKRKLASPPILAYPDFELPFTVFVDACPIALGAVLMQEPRGRHRGIAYASQALDASQQKWIKKKDGVSEIECYGLVWATTKFRPYLDRRHFTVYTDHAALVWLYKTGSKSGNGKLARWAVHLQSLDFTVVHRPGAQMGCADGLSRLPIESQGEPTPSAYLWDAETEDFSAVPLPAGGPRVCSIGSGVVGAITRGQARASEPPQEPPEAKTRKGVNPKDPSKLPRTPDRNLDGETPVSEGLEDSLVEEGPAPAAEADGVSPLKLPPYYDDTYALPDWVLRKEQARDPFTISMKAYLEDKALPLEEWLMKVVTRTSEHYEVKDQLLRRSARSSLWIPGRL
ncbi:hypothetical protein H257_17241 [Aphanomyces astaci]|uniref:RNA-directed DNA polymerase n=1 Tax=Aphanomyces astaci TaxID=112090 RepID=W4FFI0_APHAT|nr:hypothetical protein H257_17241 [Aphanomyces astaci]ETV66272.1 hypothetical protein H257_17241 [Aphanomyces astaci]|eukprot:XP_009844259.1 hypothetical protein H257_17241 [Aphanomyces astaci]